MSYFKVCKKKMTFNEKKIGKFKTVFKDWLASSSCHGYPRVLENDKILFMFWIIFPTLAASGAIFFITSTITSYLNYEVVTNINVYSENSAVFPSVSICNQNPFVTDYASDYVQNAIQTLGLNTTFTTTSNFIEKLDFNRNVLLSILSTQSQEFKKKFALPFNQTIMSCIYNGMSCADDDFEWYFDFNYGNCYKFNGGKNKPLKYSNQQGKFNGLTIEYFLGSWFSSNY